MKKMNRFFGFFAFLFCIIFNHAFSIAITPPSDPPPPPPHGDYLPFVFVNNSGFDPTQVFVTGVGQNPDQTNIGYSAFDVDANGVVSLEYFANSSVEATPVALASLPQSDGNYVMYVPYTISGVFFISLIDGITIPGGGSAGSFVGPSFSNCPTPPCTGTTTQQQQCLYCNTVFDTFEFTYQTALPQVTINPTAVNFFGIPLYVYLSTFSTGSLKNLGLYQPRDYALGFIASYFNSYPSPENQQWLNLFLPNKNANTPFKFLRVLNPSLGMVGSNAIMDPQYLDNAADYGFSFLDYIWTNNASYYRTTPLVLALEPGLGTGQTYVGTILPKNQILFRSTTDPKNIVVFEAPHPAIYNQNTSQNSTSEEIFAGNTPYSIDTSPGQVDGVQLAKLFSEAIMAGVLPDPNPISNSYVNSFFPFYNNSTYLPLEGQTTGPWYNGYSKPLHQLGPIYTYAYDDSSALWGSSCASTSTNFTLNPLTYVGITVGQCTPFKTAVVGLVSSNNPSIESTNVTFTATVVGTNPKVVPTGFVQFTVNGSNFGVPQPLVNGSASISSASLTQGSYIITANYSGDTFYPAVSSPALTQYVISSTAAATTTTLYSTLNPSQVGQEVVFIAVVNTVGGIATPTGNVSFLIDGSPVATKSLGTYGRAFYATSALSAGSHTVDVHYSGDINFLPSISPTLNQVVTENVKAPTVTFLTSTPNPSEFGSPVLITADVIGNFGPVQGFVAFFVDGVRYLEKVTDGIAALILSDLSTGQHQIIARYLGDQFNLPSLSDAVTQIVIPVTRHVNPPIDLHVNQIKNQFATQTDRINILSWKPPLTGARPILYKIYRDSQLKDEIGAVRPSIKDIISLKRNSLSFEDHNRRKNKTYRYFIVSVDALNRESVPAEITFKP